MQQAQQQLVPLANSSGALAQPLVELQNLHQWANENNRAAGQKKVLHPKGPSIPVRIEDIRKTKQRVDKDGKAISEPCYSLKVTVGDLTGCHGPGSSTGNSTGLLFPLFVGKLAATNHVPLPRSVVTKEEIQYKLITPGMTLWVFVPTRAAPNVVRKEIFYLQSLTATYTIRLPANTTAARPPPRFPGTQRYQPRVRGPPSLPYAMANDGASSAAAAPDQQVYPSPWQLFAERGKDVANEIMARLPTQVPYVPGFLSNQLRECYQELTDARLSNEQRVRLEFERTDVAGDANIPPELFAQGYRGNVALNCQRVIPIQRESYPGQSIVDRIALYRQCPEVETVLTRAMMFSSASQPPSLIVVSRPAEVLDSVALSRFAENDCRASIITTFKYLNEPKKGPNGPTSAWLSYLPSAQTNFPSADFSAAIKTWPSGTRYCESDQLFTCCLRGSIYSEQIADAFGIKDPEAWTKFAEIILNNTEIWYSAVVSPAETALMDDNEETESSVFYVRIESLAADFANALRERIGIRITAEKACALLNRTVPVPAALAAEKKKVGQVTNLSENPDDLVAAVACDCDFFVLSALPSLHRLKEIKLPLLGTEVGCHLLGSEWYDEEKTITVKDASMVRLPAPDTFASLPRPLGVGEMNIEPGHKIRLRTQAAKDITFNTMYVYAVRPDTGADFRRALRTLDVFCNGAGKYDPATGIPILERIADTRSANPPTTAFPEDDGDAEPVAPDDDVDAYLGAEPEVKRRRADA